MYVNGDAFFLGDTGWLLFSKLNREEAQKYRENRLKRIQFISGYGLT